MPSRPLALGAKTIEIIIHPEVTRVLLNIANVVSWSKIALNDVLAKLSIPPVVEFSNKR